MDLNPQERAIADYLIAQRKMSSSPSQFQAKTPAKKKKNFWLDQISTVGGILGGIGGSFIAPIAGTAGGAAVGSGLGEAIENLITGDSVGKNVAKEAALGGVFGAGPLKLLKGGAALATGKGLEGASKAATTSLLNRGARAPLISSIATGSEDNTGRVLRTSVGGKINALGDKALMSQYGTIGKNVARETRPTETIKQLADIGITKPVDAERIAAAITGSNGILTKAVASATAEAGKVPVTGLKSIINKSVTSNGLVGKDAKSVINTLTSQLKTISADNNSPSSVIKVMRNLEKRIANLQGRGGNYRLSTPERVDQANVLMAVRDELEDRLYRVSGGNKNLPNVLTGELRDQLLSLSPNNTQWQSYIDDVVMQSKDIGTLRSAQAPFVRVGKIIEEGADNSMTFGGRASGIGGGGTVANTVVNIMAENLKNPAARAISNPLRSYGRPIATPGRGNQGVLGALGIGTRLGTTGVIGSGVDQSIGPNILDSSTMTNAATNNIPSTTNMLNIDPLNPNAQDLSSMVPENRQLYSLENAIFDIQRDPKNADYYMQLFKFANPEPATQKAGFGRPSAQQYSQAITGLNSIDQIEQMLSQDPSLASRNATPGQNLPGVGGLVSRAAGTSEYRAAANNILNSIARINTGAAMPASEEEFYNRTYLPQPGDPPETIQRKLTTLRQFFDPIANYQDASTGTLEDAILQAQQGGAF